MTSLALKSQQSKALRGLINTVALRLIFIHFCVAVTVALLVLAIGGQENLHSILHKPEALRVIFLMQIFLLFIIPKLFLQRCLLKPLKSYHLVIASEKQVNFNKYIWIWFFIAFVICILLGLLKVGTVGTFIAYYASTRIIVMRLIKLGDADLEITKGYLL